MGRWFAAELLFALAMPSYAAPARSGEEAREALAAASGRVLQGDGRGALDILRTIPSETLSVADQTWQRCVQQRLGSVPQAERGDRLPQLARDLLLAYRRYWGAALTDSSRRDSREEVLRRRLAGLLGAPRSATMGQLEARIAERLRPLGLHVLTGRTLPLREFMLWRKETRELRDVALPEGRHQVPVVILDGFASLGWSAWATCDRSMSGGWVRADGIYAVRPGWSSLDKEDFLVSFLGHEAQHFADQARFAGLAPWELEYRAKLAEVAMTTTRHAALLRAFASNQSDDRSLPHAYANRLVLEALCSNLRDRTILPLEQAEPTMLSDAARRALMLDTAVRQAADNL